MNKTFLKKIRALLEDQKVELLKSTAQDLAVDNEGDETDEIQANQLIELNNQLISRNAAKVRQINSALQKIRDGSYGLCHDCEEAIPEKRLLANPYVQTCISCAEEREAEDKQRKRF